MFHLEAPNTTLEGLTDLLAPVGLLMDVIDMTGLEGRYSVTLDFSLNDAFASAAAISGGADPGSSRDPRSDMQNAILKGINDGLLKLGLRLEHRKGPVRTIVADYAANPAATDQAPAGGTGPACKIAHCTCNSRQSCASIYPVFNKNSSKTTNSPGGSF